MNWIVLTSPFNYVLNGEKAQLAVKFPEEIEIQYLLAKYEMHWKEMKN